jgi:hypothetical protein
MVMTNKSVKIMGNKLSREELDILSRKLRGKRPELATRANVSKGTVNNTFQGQYQNLKVLKAAAEMLKEQKELEPVIVELREELRD